MKLSSTVVFRFDSPDEAVIFYQSFMPEFHSIPMKRSTWTITAPDPALSEISLQIESADATAFRATINSLIIFAHAVEKSLDFTINHLSVMDTG